MHTVLPSKHKRVAAKPGIVHIGLGAFARAHIARYTEDVLNAEGGDWLICAANIRSNSTLVKQLQQQHYRYHLLEYASAQELTIRPIRAIAQTIYAGDGHSAELIGRIAELDIKIISLTITEKGYFVDMSSGELLIDAAEIQADLNSQALPRTAIGIIVAALQERREQHGVPLAILSCDNVPNNGRLCGNAVIQYAQQVDTSLADWIERNVSFPSTMVDRIVPSMTERSLADANAILADNGIKQHDDALIVCESFSQWVIEDKFPQGRPNWHLAGAQLVKDVAPYEEMKLRLLNGSHSLLAYLGYLGQLPFISDCMQRAEYRAFVLLFMRTEAAPTLTMPENADLQHYMDSLLARFGNASLQHQTWQIAMDGSKKIPQRWLATLSTVLARDAKAPCLTLGLAAWIRYVSAVDENGEAIEVSDPLAAHFAQLHDKANNTSELIRSFLGDALFAASGLIDRHDFVDELCTVYDGLLQRGARSMVAELVATHAG